MSDDLDIEGLTWAHLEAIGVDSLGDVPSGRDKRQQDELAALYQIASLSAAQLDPWDVVSEILRIAGHVLHAQTTLLFTCRDDEVLRLHDQDGGVTASFSIGRPGVLARVFVGQSGEVVNELTDEEEGDEELRAAIVVHQVAAVPLLSGERSLGVLAAANSTRGAFTAEDLRVLSILGDRLALTVEKSRLLQVLQRQVRELEGLQRLSKLLTSSGSIENVVSDTVRMVMEQIECEKMAILLYDEENDMLVAHPPAVGMTPDQLDRLRIPMNEPSIGGTVFRTNTPLMSNDAANDAWVSRALQQLLDTRSLLVVPLTTGAQALGILMAINVRAGAFSDDDLQYAGLLGRQAGAVLEANLARVRERELMRELREADRAKSEFVSMLAHELKGPMTTVLGFSHTLRGEWQKLDDPKRDQLLDIIYKEVDRLSRLVSDLLDVARMEGGSVRHDIEPVSLQEVLDNVLMVHTSLRADHAIMNEVPEDLPKVLTDRDRVRQVIINLLTNATRYSPDGSTITISADVVEEDGEPYVRVGVSDEGIGIAPQDSEKIFSKFAMLPKPGWAKKGTGLGLFITKGIVETMGGRIWVESEVGRGSTFYVTLRVAKDASSS